MEERWHTHAPVLFWSNSLNSLFSHLYKVIKGRGYMGCRREGRARGIVESWWNGEGLLEWGGAVEWGGRGYWNGEGLVLYDTYL